MWAALRIRGRTGIKKDIQDTLEMLRLNRINHAVIIPENPSYLGMLQKAKDYLTWGEIDQETLTLILSKRGRLEGNQDLTEEYLAQETDYKNMEDLSQAIIESQVDLVELGIKPVFRLHPPRKGYKNIKKAYNDGGSLGYRGDIGSLLRKMV